MRWLFVKLYSGERRGSHSSQLQERAPGLKYSNWRSWENLWPCLLLSGGVTYMTGQRQRPLRPEDIRAFAELLRAIAALVLAVSIGFAMMSGQVPIHLAWP